MSLTRRSFLSLPPNPSNALTRSLSFSRSVQRGLWAAQWRIWRLFSTASFVTSSTSDTRSLTTTSIPTTMHTNRYMARTCTTATHARTVTAHKQADRHFFYDLLSWNLGMLALCALMESSMSICPLGTVSQQVTVGVWQPLHLLQAHTQWWNTST